MEEIKLGVVGYVSQKFDEDKAKRLLKKTYNSIDCQYLSKQKIVVSGLTDVGVISLAYKEAVLRGWKTVGIACARAQEKVCFPVDKKIIVGNEWGDESPTFLEFIDVLVRVGGGRQSLAETAEFLKRGKPVFEYDLPSL